MNKLKFTGVVKDGIRQYYRPSLLREVLSSMEGQQFEEVIGLKHEDTTNDQHGYYRAGIIRATCMECEMFGGWTEDEIHEYFSSQHLTYTFHKKMGDKTVEVKGRYSTSELGKKRMAVFITAVLDELAEHGIYPLEPEAYYLGKYKTINHVGNKKE